AYANTDLNPAEVFETLSYEGFRKLVASRKMLGVAWEELNKSYGKSKFVEASPRLVPDVRTEDLNESYSGIRAQLVNDDGELVKDPLFVERGDAVHILNAVSPGMTCSFPFGEHIAEKRDD
ncbi:MAG: L-2-hydroxyglutarate oxidase, partial [Halolamina sp.]